MNSTLETATFGAGCFWGVEQAFRQLEGVVDAIVGYTGGHTEGPTYREVCTGTTGHAEAVQLAFDPTRVTYEALLDVFWRMHDPTQVNRQGPDVGSQYRSVIFVHSARQEALARASRSALDAGGSLPQPVATEIAQAGRFWPAEDYHQQYLAKRGIGSCHIPI